LDRFFVHGSFPAPCLAHGAPGSKGGSFEAELRSFEVLMGLTAVAMDASEKVNRLQTIPTTYFN
jgi:hypothetical protein